MVRKYSKSFKSSKSGGKPRKFRKSQLAAFVKAAQAKKEEE